MFLTLGKDAATMAALFMIGLNICLGREKQTAGTVFDDTLSGHYQWAICSGSACAAIFVCNAGTGNICISVYGLRDVDCTVYFILCERKKLAQLVL